MGRKVDISRRRRKQSYRVIQGDIVYSTKYYRSEGKKWGNGKSGRAATGQSRAKPAASWMFSRSGSHGFITIRIYSAVIEYFKCFP
jgi:hypothetical protein